MENSKLLHMLIYMIVYIHLQRARTFNQSAVSERLVISELEDNVHACDNYGTTYPMDDNVTDTCFMEINKGDIDEFVYQMHKRDFQINLLNMHLKFSEDVEMTTCTVTHLDWIWTFPGQNGGSQYLYVMKEYSIYSLGILNQYTFSMEFGIDVKGNCPVIIGQRNTTERIGLAFLQAFNRSLVGKNDADITYGYVCYISRIYMEETLFYFSKYIITPMQTIGYRCCNNTFDIKMRKDNISCHSTTIMIDKDLWWNFPYVMGWLIFLVLPIPFMNALSNGQSRYKTEQQHANDWLHVNPISIGMVLKSLHLRTFTAGRLFSCFIKIFCVLLTSTFIVIEVLAYFIFHNEFVISLTRAGSPFNWITMAAGYRRSKNSFLPCFGGPYVALMFYLVTFSIILCVPYDLSIFIKKGLEDRKGQIVSLLAVDLTTRSKLGAIFNIQRQSGYERFYSILKANVYMLINPSFWSLGFQLQIRRLQGYKNILYREGRVCKLIIVLLLIPVYLLLCVCEWLLSVLLYGCPVMGFFVVIVHAYYHWVKCKIKKTDRMSYLVSIIFIILMTIIVAFDIYIFSLIFIDSFVFLSRICTYVFTGLIAYPDVTYGYFVFTITVIIYVTESIQHIDVVYSRLFENAKVACEKYQRKRLFPAVPLIRMNESVSFLSAALFRYVVHYKRPVRIEILFSIFKLMLILIVLYMSISIILAFKEISKMTTLTQTITALFICLLPKLYKMFTRHNTKSIEVKEASDVKNIIEQYCTSYIHERVEGHIDLQHVDPQDVDPQDLDQSIDKYSDEEDSTEELLLDLDI
jgi:hypothetical protein